MRRLELQLQATNGRQGSQEGSRAKTPKLPSFVDGKDDLDSYLLRFERFAATSGWERTEWATCLSALLTGKALDVYSRLAEEDAVSYDALREALLRQYDLTEDGYRQKFRRAKPEGNESSAQFAVRLQNYLHKWVEMAGCGQSWGSVSKLFVREQFLESCPRELATRLREQAPPGLDDLTKLADQYLAANGKVLAGSGEKPKVLERVVSSRPRCFRCNGIGHTSRECLFERNDVGIRRCFICNLSGHLAKDCRARPNARQNAAVASVRHIEQVHDQRENMETDNGHEDYVTTSSGRRVPMFSSVCVQPGARTNLPIVKGLIGEQEAETLRDTGSTGIMVKKRYVSDHQLTGKFGSVKLFDTSVIEGAFADIVIDTPYLKGRVEALCLPNMLYDLVIGNVSGARDPSDPDPAWGLTSLETGDATLAQTVREKECREDKTAMVGETTVQNVAEELEAVADKVDPCEEMGATLPSGSFNASPLFMEKKEDGSTSFLHDHGEFNKVSTCNLEQITSAFIFQVLTVAENGSLSKGDQARRCWKMPAAERDIPKRYCGATFMRLRETLALRGLRPPYRRQGDHRIDDIAIHDRNWEDHVGKVLTRRPLMRPPDPLILQPMLADTGLVRLFKNHDGQCLPMVYVGKRQEENPCIEGRSSSKRSPAL